MRRRKTVSCAGAKVRPLLQLAEPAGSRCVAFYAAFCGTVAVGGWRSVGTSLVPRPASPLSAVLGHRCELQIAFIDPFDLPPPNDR
jgi:hypothetical protein